MNNKTSIIILKYNYPDVEKACVQSVLEHTSDPYDLILFDNFSAKYSISKIWNKLVLEARASVICLLNSDTIVTPNWLEPLKESALKPGVGAVGCLTDNCHNHQNTPLTELEADYSKYYPNEYLSGFCLCFKKESWYDVDGFDEKFGFYGQEVDFIKKLVNKKYKQILRSDSFVYHVGSASANKAGLNQEEERKKAKKLLCLN